MSDTAAVVRPAEGVFVRLFDDELLIVDLSRGEYFSLDDVGARLWGGLEKGQSIEQVAKDVMAEYDVAFDVALADLRSLSADLIERGLLVCGAPERAVDR
ncbi:MAG: PqqD family protein [Polyangiaceae bacterium]|jgi:hypothetical protein